jgi:hypothetical protein
VLLPLEPFLACGDRRRPPRQLTVVSVGGQRLAEPGCKHIDLLRHDLDPEDEWGDGVV